MKKLIAVSASPDLQETVGLYIEQDGISLKCEYTVETVETAGEKPIVYQGESFGSALEAYKYEREMHDLQDHLIRL